MSYNKAVRRARGEGRADVRPAWAAESCRRCCKPLGSLAISCDLNVLARFLFLFYSRAEAQDEGETGAFSFLLASER